MVFFFFFRDFLGIFFEMPSKIPTFCICNVCTRTCTYTVHRKRKKKKERGCDFVTEAMKKAPLNGLGLRLLSKHEDFSLGKLSFLLDLLTRSLLG